jgi:IclR family transcriptional regulator, KDG regulon repressor
MALLGKTPFPHPSEDSVRREKTNYIIQSVSHALDVLEQFSPEHDELGVTELSKRLKLHKNNVFRLLATLESRGYIEQNKATENYRLGIRCLQLGQTYVAQMGLLRQARPIIEDLARSANETAFVAILRKACVVPLDAVEAPRPVRLTARVGENLPLHCTAAGKVQLAFIPDATLRETVAAGLHRFTDQTLTDPAALQQQLKRIADTGYAMELGEHIVDVHSIAAPIRDYTRNVVGSLAVSGPAHRMGSERLEKEISPLVRKAGLELSSRLGFKE